MNPPDATDRRNRHAHCPFRLTKFPAAALLMFFFWAPLAFGAMADHDIETAVDTRLGRDDAIQAQMIDVAVRDGVVALEGRVPSLAAAERAVRIAMTVKGVRAVVDRIAVIPPERPDQAIREDVRQALALDPVTDVDAIAIAVRDAEVVLSGAVDSWQRQTLAAAVVKGVEGVREVVNRLEVEMAPDRPDGDMAAEIEKRLAWDVWVEASGIDVAVNDGQVRLSGVVGSLAEKEKALRNAWVSGVRSVTAENLKVDWERHRAGMKQRPRPKMADDEVVAAVEAALRYDPRVPEETVEVWSDNGVVTLKGAVDLLSAARAARQDAENTAGVWIVHNRVKVRPSVGPDYRPIRDLGSRRAEKVRLAFLLDPRLRQHAISVTVKDAMAVLEGQVASDDVRERATDVAAGVRGIVRVINRLEVVSDPETPRGEDWQIQKAVESEMRWSPFVDADGVSVAVDDGVAVLTGVVEDLRARRAATVNAREGGAVRVKNHLGVRYGPDFLQP